MFRSVDRTWNVSTGCSHGCVYCCARRLAQGRLQHSPRYADGFTSVRFHESELKKKFKPGETVFVSFMGDLFCAPVVDEQIRWVIRHTFQFPKTDFLFLTKNPGRYSSFLFGENSIVGTTLESNREYKVSFAPAIGSRVWEMRRLLHWRKFVSIEPVMDFDVPEFCEMLKSIKPEMVEIGADNYHCGLQEPDGAKVAELIRYLRTFVPIVNEKTSLKRLMQP